ncbi:MAG: helix-turn-helix domain-containing protein [Oscillospiraceae bacterium]
MRRIPKFEEKSEPYHLLHPVRVHRLTFPPGSEIIFYPHWHREFELFYVLEGGALFSVDEREYLLSEGEGVFLLPGALHSCHGLEGVGCTFQAVVFYDTMICENRESGAYKAYVAPVQEGRLLLPERLHPDIPWQKRALAGLREIAAIPQNHLAEQELFLRGKLLEIWQQLFSHGEAVPEQSFSARSADHLTPVIEYIHSHYMEDISLAQLAELASLSPGRFCKVFKEQLQMTPFAYIIRHRILQSCRFLGETDSSITEIANRTGFNSVSYFNRTFRTTIGCTPSAYRLEGERPPAPLSPAS